MNLREHDQRDDMKVWLSQDEASALLDAADGTEERITLGARCGLRSHEVLDVAPEDVVDTEAGTMLRVQPRERRRVPRDARSARSRDDDPDGRRRARRVVEVIEDYRRVNRPDASDDQGRRPLIATNRGRMSISAMRDTVYRLTRPCEYGDCPHDRDPDACEAMKTGRVELPVESRASRRPRGGHYADARTRHPGRGGVGASQRHAGSDRGLLR